MGCLLLLFRILLCFHLLLFHFPFFSSSISNSSAPLCYPDQSSALLQFKNSFHLNITEASGECDQPYPKTITWENGTDCCSWMGVTCDSVSGHVIGLDLNCSGLYGNFHRNSTLFRLTHLQGLNLAHNHFNGSQLPSQLGGLVSLTHLNLSESVFTGDIPSQISHLSKLASLDLSLNYHLKLNKTTWKRFVHNATVLREIILDRTNMSSLGPNPLSLLSKWSSSLVTLSLSSTGIRGQLTSDILCLPNLIHLDLSRNELTGSIPASISNLQHLILLDLSSNQLNGQISDVLGGLTKLQTLSLYGNNLGGQLPSSLFSLTQLSLLDCSSNKFEGGLPNKIIGFSYLTQLDLSGNLLNGTIPSWCLSLPSLTSLYLSNNRFTGHIGAISSYALSSLDLCGNKLLGNIPESFFNLVNLTLLCMSSDNYDSPIHFPLFSKFQNLEFLSLSGYKSLSLKSDINANYSFSNLIKMRLLSNNLIEDPRFSGKFPKLEYLELSNSTLQGEVPKWIRDMDSLSILILSHNLLTSLDQFPWYNLFYIDLSSNLMTGDISSFICNAISLQVVNLSHNKFTGTFPQCLANFSSLAVVDLQLNKLHGTLPNIFPMSKDLETLNLNGNQLEGLLPKSLSNYTDLIDLNLGNNQLEVPTILYNLKVPI